MTPSSSSAPGSTSTRPREQLPVDTATSLALAGAEEVDRNRLVAAYLSTLAGWYAALTGAGPGALPAPPTAGGAATVGRPVTVSRPDRPDVVGTAVAVDDDGRLVIDSADGRHAWAAGDVTHVRSAG